MPQDAWACLEEPGVGHDVADALRPPDDPRLAYRSLQHAKNAGVENGDDLGQSRKNRDFCDAHDQLAENIADPVRHVLRLPRRSERLSSVRAKFRKHARFAALIVISALTNAERRGVAIRIVLDPRERHDFVKLGDLSDNVRIKRGGPFMHLKAYAIDGRVLRTGSANFSTSGENAQDNDLIVIRDAGTAAKFDAHFERMWDAAEPMIEFAPAINALEPR